MNACFASRRVSNARPMSWGQNRNMVRHEPKVSLGTMNFAIAMMALLLVVILIFLSQGTKVTTYDHEVAAIDAEIAALEAQRDALAVENAKIMAEAASEEGNEVASTMSDAQSAGFVAN